MKHQKKIILCIFLFVVFYAYLQYKVIKYENFFVPSKSTALVILGHSLENGENPDKWLVERLKTGLELYESGYADIIAVTGGTGFYDKIPVAVAMEEWLIQNGVPSESIIVENKSKDTIENFKFLKNMDNNIDSILVVTNDFHMYRSMEIANHYFNNVSGQSAKIPFSFRKILAYLKEPLSLIKVSIYFMSTSQGGYYY